MATTKLNVLDVSSDTTTSGVSWSAIFARASAAATAVLAAASDHATVLYDPDPTGDDLVCP